VATRHMLGTKQAAGLSAIRPVVERSDTTGHRTHKSPAPQKGCQNTMTLRCAMPSTYLSLHYHLIFGTKDRAPFIEYPWRSRLHDYLGGNIRGLSGFPQEVGGVVDHVHLLAGLKATHCLADVMRELEKASSAWVHDEIGRRSFTWQEGYAAFTVSATAREAVRQYIARQEEHHRTKSFRDELVEMLKKAGIEYDPKYLD
jgi:REP-associated tyrosine transposase